MKLLLSYHIIKGKNLKRSQFILWVNALLLLSGFIFLSMLFTGIVLDIKLIVNFILGGDATVFDMVYVTVFFYILVNIIHLLVQYYTGGTEVNELMENTDSTPPYPIEERQIPEVTDQVGSRGLGGEPKAKKADVEKIKPKEEVENITPVEETTITSEPDIHSIPEKDKGLDELEHLFEQTLVTTQKRKSSKFMRLRENNNIEKEFINKLKQ